VSGKQSDSDHCENMIDAAERMRETMYEAVRVANTDMRRCRMRRESDGDSAKS